MKKITLFAIALISSLAIKAQTNIPNLMNLVAVVRDSSGTPLANDTVSLQLEIATGAIYQGGVVRYCELLYSVVTNSHGEIAQVFGYPVGTNDNYTCNSDSSLEQAQWENGNTYYRLSWKLPNLGANFVPIDSGFFKSIPYAFAARTAEQLVTPGASNGQVLTWNAATNKWEPAAPGGSGGGTVTFITAGTGLTGGTITGSGTIGLSNTGVTANSYGNSSSYPTFTVNGQGQLTAAGTQSLPASLPPNGSATGDLNGTFPSPSVAKIQGIAVSSTAPASNQVLQYDGSQWAPATNSSSVPAGSIMAYGGNSVPAGWLLCDGTSYSTASYPNLFAAIGSNFGSSGSSFNVPDLRGMFLRGVDGFASNDPDHASRTAMNTGGNTGNAIGSVQADAFKSHTHTGGGAWATDVAYYPATNGAFQGPNNTGATGGNETRPKNAYVNYIIKY